VLRRHRRLGQRLDRPLQRLQQVGARLRVQTHAERADRQRAARLRVARLEQAVEVEVVADVGVHVFGGRVLVARRRQEVDAAVDADQDVIVAHPQSVPVAQLDLAGHRGGLVCVVDEDAVGAGVDQPVLAAVELHLEVMARHDAARIGQHPVVVRGAADVAAIDAENPRAVLAEFTVVFADDSKFDGHVAAGAGFPGHPVGSTDRPEGG
jgi:hypothetical protein